MGTVYKCGEIDELDAVTALLRSPARSTLTCIKFGIRASVPRYTGSDYFPELQVLHVPSCDEGGADESGDEFLARMLRKCTKLREVGLPELREGSSDVLDHMSDRIRSVTCYSSDTQSLAYVARLADLVELRIGGRAAGHLPLLLPALTRIQILQLFVDYGSIRIIIDHLRLMENLKFLELHNVTWSTWSMSL